jgi:hypothetical protein
MIHGPMVREIKWHHGFVLSRHVNGLWQIGGEISKNLQGKIYWTFEAPKSNTDA